jgi:hypothetical protein
MNDFFRSPLLRGAALMLAAIALLAGLQLASRQRATDKGSTAASVTREPAEVAEPPEKREPVLRVLFVGNSLSAPIPALLRAMGDAAGLPIHAAGQTPGGKTLEFHAANAATLQRIAAERWDAVVLQDQAQRPSFSEEQRAREMYPAGARLVRTARAVGAEPWLYGAYARPAGDPDNRPGDDYEAMQTRVDDGYARLAERTSTRVVPVGRAFRTARVQLAHVQLWKSDGMHASTAGTYLVAAVFFAALLRRDPRQLAYDGGLAPEDARALRAIAQNTVARELGFALDALPEGG